MKTTSKAATTLIAGMFAICPAGGTFAAPATPSEEVVGYVKTIVPEATIWRNGKAIAAEPGTALLRGSSLRTGRNGSLGATLRDNTVISIGPDTQLSVDDFLYDPAKGDLALVATLSKGSLYYIPGVIARLRPEAVTINTPTGVIGAKGSRFLARVDTESKAIPRLRAGRAQSSGTVTAEVGE